jgi:hypothetical protein
MPQTSEYFVKKSTRLYFNWCLVHFWVLLAPMAIPLSACGADSRPPWNARQIADMGADGVGHPGTGLHCLTGRNTESAHPQEMTDEELCSFIYSPVM